MKNHFLTIVFTASLFCMLYQASFAQNTIENPQVTPMTPESASLGRYGNVALNGATGQMNYSIPIYNIQVDGNSWPIALNYNYSGLILEGKPSLSGLGWHLSAYGNITKEARGLPDGHPYGYYGDQDVKAEVNSTMTDYLADGNFNQTPFTDLEKFSNGTWDSEVDKYTVNIGGVRFSFKLRLDTNQNPVAYYLSRHNYKVENIQKLVGEYFEMASFEVVDDKGVRYYFDSTDREQLAEEPVHLSPFWGDRTTSWLLSKIEYTNGQLIEFDYELDEDYSVFDFAANGFESDLDNSEPGQNQIDLPVQNWNTGYNEGTLETKMDRLILKSISFPQGSIHFTTTTTQGRKLFSKIELKDINTTVVDTYDLTYMEKRDALTKVKKNSEDFYDFEYYGVHTPGYIPEFIDSTTDYARDQDYWKFFNSAGNERAIHMPFSSELADKLPNFSATRLGALRRIIYPTKGYTEIDYEQNQVKTPYEENPGGNDLYVPFNDDLVIRVDAKLNNNERYATITKTFDYPVVASLYHKIKGNVVSGNAIYLTIEKISGDTGIGTNGDCYANYTPLSFSYYPMEVENAKSSLEEDCPYYPYPILSPGLNIAHDPDNHCVWYPGSGDDFSESMGCVSQTEIDAYDSSRGRFWIVPGTYKFTIDVTYLWYDDLFAEIGLRWYDPAPNGPLPEFMDVNVGGIRVKTMTDYTGEGEFANIKHYDYTDDDDYSTGRLNQTPYFKNEHIWEHSMSSHTPQEWTHELDEYLLNSYTGLNLNHGIPVYYSRIRTYNSDIPSSTPPLNGGGFDAIAKPNGYTIQTFYLPNEDVSGTYPLVPVAEDLTKAVPDSTYIKNSSGITLSKKSLVYDTFRWDWEPGNSNNDNSTDHPWSFKYYKNLENDVDWDCVDSANGQGCFENLTPALNTDQDNALKSLHDIKPYKEVDLIRMVKKEVSVSQGVAQVQEFIYDSNLLLQSVANNPNIFDFSGETRIEYDYPYEVIESQYQNMENKNQVAIPIVQRSYKNDVLLSQQKTNFTLVQLAYRPSEILVAKGNEPLKKEIEFIYNDEGGITEYTRNDGNSPPTSFIWGYDETVPVAKIDNATYSQVLAALSGTYATMQTQDNVTLRNTLNSIRQGLPDALVTSYTYKPLIGVSSITDPRGETIHYTYDALNRLEYIKDKNEDVLEEYNYNLRLDAFDSYLLCSSNSALTGTDLTFTAIPVGGSGNYSYEWTDSADLNNVITTATNSLLVTTTAAHEPGFNMTCVVTDTQTNETITTTKFSSVFASYPALSVSNITYSGNSSKIPGELVTYDITVSGGSGDYSFSWRRINSLGVEKAVGNGQTLIRIVGDDDCAFFKVFCRVTDTTTNNYVDTSEVIINVSGCSGNPN